MTAPEAGADITIDIPEPREVLVHATRSGLPEIIVINKALLAFPHTEVFCWHLVVTLDAVDLIDSGMPSPADSALLFEIGDEIDAALHAARTNNDAPNVLFLARSTWNGQRELIYYVHDPELAHAALQSLIDSRAWEREWSFRMEGDAAWEKAGHVFQVFPAIDGLAS
ncbi:DUF695 domain-containing protein [Massilia sp. Dwa41.01b]|uniref:DUF695 domain-containing protein n=1 Tax=unclassified Massilia TaxID=2609279 RepID=UPI001601CCF7|nr:MULTISPECIES: DUF695 domain-containing protein [unclassified Massilia]QNA88953.1 DUF695 domain-containing protein [Massilia sp. Dwa41.01b]QNA99841.1 DUF695 domain-containing protein [Massilia sp. Se16.2.3]